MLIDTHAHINFKDYRDDGDEVIKRALENDIWMINVGAEFETSQRAVEYAEKYPKGVFAAIGLHPIHLMPGEVSEKELKLRVKGEEFDYQKYKDLAQSPKVVGIGEIGLDYYRIATEESDKDIKEKQKEFFKKQIELALDLDKAIIVHCRNAPKQGKHATGHAHNDVIEILKSYTLNPKFKLRGVVHSFSGNYKQARQYREMGFKVTFNGIITFARDYDKAILDSPIEDLLLETDCPYLTPIPYRGERNEPLYVIEVAKKLAEIKRLSLEKVMEQTTANAKEVFNLI